MKQAKKPSEPAQKRRDSGISPRGGLEARIGAIVDSPRFEDLIYEVGQEIEHEGK
jgi:hypothetical protein